MGRRNGRRLGGGAGGREAKWWGGAYVVRWCWGKGFGGRGDWWDCYRLSGSTFYRCRFFVANISDLKATGLGTQVLEVHILYLRRFTKLQKLHIHRYILDQNFKHLNIIHVSVKLEYVELQMKI